MNQVIVEGKNLEHALDLATNELNIENVGEGFDYEILEETEEKTVIKATKTFEEIKEEIADPDDVVEGVKDFLEKLVEKMGYDSEIEVIDARENEGSIVMDIVPKSFKDNSQFIGKRGETLQSIGIITNLFIKNNFNTDLRIEVDCGDYLYSHKEDIKAVSRSVAKKALQYGSYKMRPMNAYDRRVVHQLLTDEFPELTTHSEGEEPARYVVIEKKPQ